MVTTYLMLLALLGVERLYELRISARHRTWALAHGGLEVGQRHLRWMKLLHGGFLFGCAAEVVLARRPFWPPLGLTMLALALAAQGLRYWAISVLGRYWNIRVIVIPGAPVVDGGPFRYLRHPNYLAVIVEGIAVPLIHTAWITALSFTVLNAALLIVRIRCEEQALAEHCGYMQRLGERHRLLPWRARAGGS